MKHADRTVQIMANVREGGGNYTVTVPLKYSKILHAYILDQEGPDHSWSSNSSWL